LSDLSLIGALGGVELGLKLSGVPCGDGGVGAAMSVLAASGGAPK
jgi:alanine-glyoxylate transaminase/serine-glyoxylate transaminase/serine-pyruvate transaminase